jgi:ribosomal-protein-alanine N-acetyltransferase
MCSEFMVFSPSGALDREQAIVRFSELVHGPNEKCLGKLALIEKQNTNIIGYCGIEPCEIEGRNCGELGFRLSLGSRNKGYATEAARAILAYEQDRGRKEVVAIAEPDNVLSIHVLFKLGFTKVCHSSYLGMPVILFELTM